MIDIDIVKLREIANAAIAEKTILARAQQAEEEKQRVEVERRRQENVQLSVNNAFDHLPEALSKAAARGETAVGVDFGPYDCSFEAAHVFANLCEQEIKHIKTIVGGHGSYDSDGSVCRTFHLNQPIVVKSSPAALVIVSFAEK